MGKKGKKANKTQDGHLPVSDEVKLELEDGDFNLETNNSNLVKKTKKKRKLDEATAKTNSDEINESNTPEDEGIQKKKKKKRNKNNEQAPDEELQTVTNNLDEEQLHISKKKKKSQISGEDIKQEINEALEAHGLKPQKDTTKKKNTNDLANEVKHKEITPETENKEIKQKNKKGKKKAKTGTPVLNNEEAQVTEEDIDKFIDELDEEDNKQYEDWVKLLDARLSKKTKAQ